MPNQPFYLTLLRTLPGLGDEGALAVTPDGTRAVFASNDNTLKVWDLQSGREVLTLEGHAEEVREVAVTRDGKKAPLIGLRP